MNLARTGKIARLPRAVRQELNQRLDDGEQGKLLVSWLNSLPEVQAVVASEFAGKPIRPQNLSEWRQGGYRDWQAQQQAVEMALRLCEDAAEWSGDGHPPLTDVLAHWLVARYALATRRIAETGGREGWRLLRDMCGDIVELRKGDHSAQRLQLDRERLALERKKTDKRAENGIGAFLRKAGANSGGLTREEQTERIREIFKQPSPGKRNGGISPETLEEIERAAKLL